MSLFYRCFVIQFKGQQIMSSCTVLAGIPVTRTGLNYLVPSVWWQQFLLANSNSQSPSFTGPPPNTRDCSDSFLLDFKQDLVEQLEFKANFLKFHSTKISPQPMNSLKWTPVNPAIWNKIVTTHKNQQGIATILEQGKKYNLLQTTQIQIIFCSKNRSDAFVGFIPKEANLALTVRQIGFQMGFIEVVKSKVAFLDKNPQVSFNLHELEKYTISNAPGTAFMAFNMERNGDQPVSNQFSFNRAINESNEAVVGDLNTMEDDSNNHLNEAINNRTMSTGAQTPFSFVFSEGFDLDRQYRVKQLFGAKQPEQIEELKLLATTKIENDKMIELPEGNQVGFQAQLDKYADELIDSFLKKKVHKEKEKEFELYE